MSAVKNMTGDCQDDYLTSVNNDDVEELNEVFYDVCSVESSKNESSILNSKDDAAEFHDTGSCVNDIESSSARFESEKSLTEEESKELEQRGIFLKEEGNKKYKEKLFDDAILLYTQALDTCPLKFADERSKMHFNRGLTHLCLGAREVALADFDEAIKLNPNYLKCILRRAQAREDTEKFAEALDDYNKVLKLDPSNAKARASCALLPEKINAQQEKMKAEMLTQLKQLGNLVLKPFGLSTDNFKLTKDPNGGGYSVNFQQST